jgi:hypothetical protein
MKTEHKKEPQSPSLINGVVALQSLLGDIAFEQAYISAHVSLKGESQADVAREELERLRTEFVLRKDDPVLLDVLVNWGRSPNAVGERGSDGQGFNAGVVHYFEYRASAHRRLRYTDQEQPTIQGFIDFTHRIKEMIKNPNPNGNPGVQKSALIGDEEGQERLLLRTQEGLLIIGFKHLGESEIKIISVVARETSARFERRIEEELAGTPETDKRLNKLGNNRVLINVLE